MRVIPGVLLVLVEVVAPGCGDSDDSGSTGEGGRAGSGVGSGGTSGYGDAGGAAGLGPGGTGGSSGTGTDGGVSGTGGYLDAGRDANLGDTGNNQENCPPCAAPPSPDCIGRGPCGCGPYTCPDAGWDAAVGDTGTDANPVDAGCLAVTWQEAEVFAVATTCDFVPSEVHYICLEATFSATGSITAIAQGVGSSFDLDQDQLQCARQQLLGRCDPGHANSAPRVECIAGI